MVKFAFQNFLKPFDSIVNVDVFARLPGNLFGNKERLTEEWLKTARPRNRRIVHVRELDHTLNRNMYLQIFILLENLYDVLRHIIMLYPNKMGVQESGRRIQRFHIRINTDLRESTTQCRC